MGPEGKRVEIQSSVVAQLQLPFLLAGLKGVCEILTDTRRVCVHRQLMWKTLACKTVLIDNLQGVECKNSH